MIADYMATARRENRHEAGHQPPARASWGVLSRLADYRCTRTLMGLRVLVSHVDCCHTMRAGHCDRDSMAAASMLRPSCTNARCSREGAQRCAKTTTRKAK
jgi:hypothetical protein